MMTIAKAEPKYTPKSFQTLKGHCVDALKLFKAYIETNEGVIKQFCDRWQLDKSSFLRSMMFTIYFHDVGKLTKQFQENIKNGKSSPNYPHALYALYILNQIEFPYLLGKSLEKAAIVGHHTELYSELYNYDFETPSFLEHEIKNFVKDMKNVHKDMEFDKWFLFDDLEIQPLPEPRKFGGTLELYLTRLKREDSLYDGAAKYKFKSVFSYIFSILKICDWYSSAEFKDFVKCHDGTVFDSIMENPNKYISHLLIDDIYEKIFGKNKPYEYQMDEQGKLCGDVPFYGMLFAPCGRGKTEAALIWALKCMKKYNRNRIIFVMPTQITSNAMWERFCKLLGEKNPDENEIIRSGKQHVGLFHGHSFEKLKTVMKDEEDLEPEELDEINDENSKGNIFFKEITVTTIDHLIYSFIHGFSHADFAFGNLQNAIVIFDEVHYYEKQTTQHILTLLELFKKIEIPHLLMSGTLPKFFIDKAKEINSGYVGPFTDKEGLNFTPFKIEFLRKEKLITKNWINEKIINEIIENYHKGLLQFIILNTVERSKMIYDALILRLKDTTKIILHHSQFTYTDRAEKEKILQNLKENKSMHFILVATQVIEISLDISCDVMYTELAPIDAIGQRGGRLNRNGKTWISDACEHIMKIFIPEEFEDDDSKHRPYDPKLLKSTADLIVNAAYSYSKLKDVCDKVYLDYQLDIPTSLRDIFRECILFGHSPSVIAFSTEEKGRLIQIRSENVQKFDVIPQEYYAEEECNLIADNQAKVPIWWYKKDEKEHGLSKWFIQVPKKLGKKTILYWVIKIPYTKERGFKIHDILEDLSQDNII